MAIVKGSKDGVYIRLQYALSSPAGVPYAALSALADGFTLEGGTYDPVTTITTQTTAAAALGIPDLAGVAQDWVFTKVAQTLAAKTLTAPNWTGAMTGSSTCSIVMGNATYTYTLAFSTNSLLLSATDLAAAKLVLGSTGTHGLDVTIQGAGATATIIWDAALGTLTTGAGVSLVMSNATVAYTFAFSTNTLLVSATDNAGSKLILGTTGTNGLDITIQGVGTATITWDAALGTLTFGAGAYVAFPADNANGRGLVIPVKTTSGDPGSTGTVTGNIVYNSFDHELLVWDGAAWLGEVLS